MNILINSKVFFEVRFPSSLQSLISPRAWNFRVSPVLTGTHQNFLIELLLLKAGPNIKTAIAILNCLLARQLCFEDVSCSAILEIIPRVCGPELVACSTVTVTKCQAALRTLQAFPFFKPTCLCREPHVDPECNSFRDFLFDHPCVFVLKKEKDPYPVDALPTCNHALSVCQREEKCIKLFEDFKTNCKVRDNKCRMDDRELCHESWTNLRLSPMFGCICPNNHMKRRCDRIFGIVNHNPCVDMLPISLDLSGTESALYPNNPENGYFNSLWLPPTKTNQYPYFLHPATNRPRTYLHITSNIISPSPSIHQLHHFNNHHHHYAQSGTFMPVSTSGTSHKSSSSSVADSDYNHQLSIEETLNTPLEFDELPSEDIVVTVTRLSGGSADGPSDITKFAFKSTCHLALENCNNDYMCRAALQPVLHHCDVSQCHRNSCMEALQNLYRKPELSWSLEIAFCLCKTSENKQDACLVAQEKLHPICAQRVEGNQILPPCHTLAEECRKDIDCKIRLEFYEQSCAVDSTTKKCAGPPSECRAAMLGILGTELRTTCGCKGTDFTQLYDCLGWQRLLWVNPCVVQSQSDFHIKNAAIELAKMTTTPTTTIQSISSTWRSQIRISTTLAPVITTLETTLATEPTEPTTTEIITTTTSTTTSTTPPRFCVVQKPHQTTQYIREGKSKRLNRDDELGCSDLCQCAESLIVICHTICVDRIPCKTEFAFYNHAAPAYQAYRGRCLCYSGQFICMRPTPGEYKLPQGVFLFLGYSETDEALLKPHSNLSVQDVVSSLQELIMHETSCQLSIFNVTKANVILVAKIRDDDEEDETKILIKEQEQCAQILEDISEKINTQHPEFNSHLLLSIFKIAEVEVIPAKINAQQRRTTASPILITILSTVLVLQRVLARLSYTSWYHL